MVLKRIVITRSNGVDPDSRVEKEANTLKKAGYDVTILAWDRSSNYKIRIDEKHLLDTTVTRISFGIKAEFGAGMKSLKAFIKFQYRLFCWLLINRNKYDIIHLCDFDTAFTGSKVAFFLRKKYVFDIFDYISTDAKTRFQKIIKKAEDKIITNASAVIICTEERLMQIKDATPQKVVVIHNSPEKILSFQNRRFNLIDNGKIKVAYVGILQDYRLIKEMVHAISERNDFELHIGGFGKYDEYLKQESLSNNNIFYYGKIPYQETLELESKCDIMTAIYDPTIGNHYYAAPNKFYEALFLGKPLIMVRGTGMSNVIEKNDIGVLIDYCENGFISGLEKLKNRKKDWFDMGRRMKNLYYEKYSWSEMGKRLCSLYEEL